MIVNQGKSQAMRLLQGRGYLPWFIAVGNGSGVVTETQTTLVAQSGIRVAVTGSPDNSAFLSTSYVFNFSALQLSGLIMTEFGSFLGSSSGSMWSRENFIGITFNGRNELQIQNTIEVF